MKALKITIAGLVILISQSFTFESNNLIFGSYGVTNNDPSKIELVINEDHTFTFKDYSNPNKRINASGTWEMKKDFVILKSSNSKYSYHTKWKVYDNGSRAKSRNGLAFYTLCKINPKQ